MNRINIGLTDEQRYGVINLLNQDLADSYVLLVKTKKYHWDVVGPQFRTLHELWEEQYQELSENIDNLAERVRTLGGYPTSTMAGFLQITTLKEHTGEIPTSTGMVTQLIEDHEQIIRNLRNHIDRCGDEFHDQVSADFLTDLMQEHEEMAWMLRSFIEGQGLEPNTAEIKIPVAV
ncbi:Dps family protein [Okeanomitos corallinicola TIOX110]|uniref:Dps family protein n=1 Tax=Okeanomitos corallinicola TIOX110 TaxID=3133117 RepID=A0ABZ2UY11_9CYAN